MEPPWKQEFYGLNIFCIHTSQAFMLSHLCSLNRCVSGNKSLTGYGGAYL
jgi:hypothetical protein